MTVVFDFRDLAVPVLVAPMAGGPSTPELAGAGSTAGGLGFVPAGYLTAEVFAERLQAARRLTTGPVGANLFAPQPSAATPGAIEAYAGALASEAQRYGVSLGEPRFDDDEWGAKIEVLLDLRPAVASFTFGLPSADEVRRLTEAGITTVGTVTTLAEARQAAERGVDAVAAQGPSAGGHRGTFDPSAPPSDVPLDDLQGGPDQRDAARCRRVRTQAPPPHRPAADVVRGPAARVCGGRHANADRDAPRRGGGHQAPRADHARARTDANRRDRSRVMPEELHEATKLTIYVGRQERINGSPAFVAISDLFHRRRLAGATVLLGVDGTAHGLRQRARFFGRNADVPVMIITVGAGEQIAQVLPELGTLLSRPLVTLERVRVCKIDGRLLAQPTALPSSDQHGLGLWQKLMVYTSEQARYGNSPLHVACSGACAGAGRLVPHACAGSGASTATARPKAIGCCSCDVMSRSSRSSSTLRRASQGRFRSWTRSPIRPGS